MKKEYAKRGKAKWKKTVKQYNRTARKAKRSDLVVFGY